MTAIMVGEASPDVFQAMLHRNGSQATQDFYQHSQQSFSSVLNDVGQQFAQAATSIFKEAFDSSAMRLAKAAMRKVESIWMTDEIQSITSIGNLQHAPLTMQRWIMACPEVREVYHRQECDGYSDTYVDMEPGKVGEDHYDYRRVMDGTFRIDEDGDWVVTQYFEELQPGDDHLSADEKLDIENTWDAIRNHMAAKKDDPTSMYNARL